MPKASVKIMLSYNYCHFEVALSSDDDLSLKDVNGLRKDAQRLADEAVRQFKVGEELARKSINLHITSNECATKLRALKENFPESEWTPQQRAEAKRLGDIIHEHDYAMHWDYEDEDEQKWEQ